MSGAQLMFWAFAVAACGGAVAVVISQNVVRMAFWLIVSLGSVAGLFFLLHADFVGATQLLVYVGGTVVLLIFGVMLTDSGPYRKIVTPPGQGLLAAAVGLFFLILVFGTVARVDWSSAAISAGMTIPADEVPQGYNRAGEGNTARPIGLGLLGLRPDKDLGSQTTELSTGYLLPFEIISVHLLVVLIGAAYLARGKRRADTEPGS